MRLRVIQAFSGNNSGSYVLVGTFREASSVDALAAELKDVFAAHAKWLAIETAKRDERSPMYAFATDRGLTVEPNVGANDDWPTYGETPDVVAAGTQLLVFVDYSVTFPRFIGELVYRSGGRVSVELDHSHETVVISHDVWKDRGWETPLAAQAIAAFRADVESGALASLYLDDAGKVARPPILSAGFWPGNLQLVHAPKHVADGVRSVDALAKKHGLHTRLSLFETPVHGAPDPLRGYRTFENGAGEHQVILWKPGAVLADTIRAVRGATGLSVPEATELVARAPVEVLLHIAEPDAIAWRDALVAVGADAEVLGPQHFAR